MLSPGIQVTLGEGILLRGATGAGTVLAFPPDLFLTGRRWEWIGVVPTPWERANGFSMEDAGR